MPDTPSPEQTAHVQGQFVQHLPALRGFVLSLVSNFGLVDDIVQETFITVTKKAGDYEPGSNFRAWVWTIARFKTLQMIEKQGKAGECLSPEVIETLCQHESSQEWPMEAKLGKLPDCMAKLAPKARQAIDLRYMQSMRPPEIASAMQWTVEAVHVALARARVALRDCVDGAIAAEAAAEH